MKITIEQCQKIVAKITLIKTSRKVKKYIQNFPKGDFFIKGTDKIIIY